MVDMKYAKKGVWLGLLLCIVNKLGLLITDVSVEWFGVTFVAIFFAVTALFLVSDTVKHLLICGFTGLFVMLFAEAIVVRLFLEE